MTRRTEEVLALIDVARHVGLEIGPLDRPIVRPNAGSISYVDHASTEELRAKYADDAKVDKESLVEIDYVWGDDTFREMLGDRSFDYVVASHVAEHVPDLIGWMNEVHDILRPNGYLSLAIPDRRYTFDYRRPTTKLSEFVGSHLRELRRPDPQQVYEHFSTVVHLDARSAWKPGFDGRQLRRKFSDAHALRQARAAASTDRYIDVHCSVFTTRTFVATIRDLVALGLISFDIERLTPPVRNQNEFFVTLRAVPFGDINDEALASQSWFREQMGREGAADDDVEPPSTDQPSPSQGEASQRLRDNKELEELREVVGNQRRQITKLLESTSWRVTRPMRSLGDALKRLRR